MLQRAQMTRRKSVKAVPGDDDGWSDGDEDNNKAALPPPPASAAATPSATTMKPAFKPAVNKPPEKTKPPPVKGVGGAQMKRDSMNEPASGTGGGERGPTEPVTSSSSFEQPAEAPVATAAAAPVAAPPAKENPTVGAFSREAELEKQLEKTHQDLIAMRREKQALEQSVEELQQRLTAAETDHGHSSRSPEKIGSVESSIKRGEREKELEKQLLKAKRDKDKALKLIIHVIGKDRIAEHLQQHAGDPDLLDSLVEKLGGHGSPSFGSTLGGPPQVAGAGTRSNHHATRTKGNAKSTVSTLGRAHYRSRIDEYFHMNT